MPGVQIGLGLSRPPIFGAHLGHRHHDFVRENLPGGLTTVRSRRAMTDGHDNLASITPTNPIKPERSVCQQH
jgi:hypothetical protein